MTQLLSGSPEAREAVLRLANHPDFLTLINHWRVVLATMYSETCAQPIAAGRDWHAGRAALLETFLKEYDKLTEREQGIRGRKVVFASPPLRPEYPGEAVING